LAAKSVSKGIEFPKVEIGRDVRLIVFCFDGIGQTAEKLAEGPKAHLGR